MSLVVVVVVVTVSLQRLYSTIGHHPSPIHSPPWWCPQVLVMSPVSGVNKYQYDGKEKRWLSVESDRHDLIGILTRDLLRISVGCPNF